MDRSKRAGLEELIVHREKPVPVLLLLLFLKFLPIFNLVTLKYFPFEGDHTVIIMTLECRTLSDRLVVPPKYSFKRYIRTIHGIVFKIVYA